MQIGGYQQDLLIQDGIYAGLLAKASTGLNIKVAEGLVIQNEVPQERGATAAAADVAIPGADGVHKVYFNRDGAKDAQGNVLAQITVDVKEADSTFKNVINNTASDVKGQSILLAEVTVASGAITKVDNTVRLLKKNIPAVGIMQRAEKLRKGIGNL